MNESRSVLVTMGPARVWGWVAKWNGRKKRAIRIELEAGWSHGG